MKHALGTGALALGLIGPGLAMAQQCYPTNVSIGWTQPNNVAISDNNATRWPTDASIRIAFGGEWCPDPAHFELTAKDGTPVPAQVRVRTPLTLVENAAQPLTIIEVDPIETLEERADYLLVVRPPNPALIAETFLEFRTKGGPMEPIDVNAFEGIRSVGLASDTCSEDRPYEPVNPNNPQCLVSSKFRMKLEFQPLDRPELAYALYRTSTTPLDENGEPIALEADNTQVLIDVQPGAGDLVGTGVPLRPVIFDVLYAPLPRRDCYTVLMVDEWGRERGDADNIACVDLVIPEPCPRGCEGQECMFAYPEPNPFETNEPLPGQACDNIGLNGGDPNRPIPPVGEEPGEGGSGGDGEGGAGGDAPDAGMEGDGGPPATGDGGGDGGCSVSHQAPTPWWLAALLLPALRRRRR